MIQSRKAEREALAKVESGEDQEQVLKDAVVAVLEAFMGGREFYVIAMEIGPGDVGMYGPIYPCGRHKKLVTALLAPYRGSLRSVGLKFTTYPEIWVLDRHDILRFHMI